MIRIEYNENSWLDNSLVRKINFFVLFLIVVAFPISTDIAAKKAFSPITVTHITPIVSSLITTIFTSVVLSKTEFFEWNHIERKKKQNFIIHYVSLCTILSSFLGVSITLFVNLIIQKAVLSAIIIFALPILFFIFNLFNIVSLYYPIFEDDLKTTYDIEERPKDWKDIEP